MAIIYRVDNNMSDRRKRIALFIGQADEDYQSRFITGFLKHAFKHDMDVCIFSMYHKYQDTAERESGDSNIYSLMQPELFDGAVLMADTIQTSGAADRLEDMLHESFGGKPVLVIEKESRYFPSIFTSCHDAMVELVSHLIEVHGYKDIAFLSGKKWHKHAQERVEAYKEAMAKHGLEVPEDRVFYGDFWYHSGDLFADYLTAQDRPMPEAVVCANDAMAIGLCKALTGRGYRVPEDIAVASYDSTYEGRTSPKIMTSTMIPATEFGSYAADVIKDMFEGREPEPFCYSPQLVPGETCGCTHAEIMHSVRRESWDNEISLEGFYSEYNSMDINLMAQASLEEYVGAVYSYAFQLKGAKSFHLCLSNYCKYMGQTAKSRFANDGYPEKMIYAVRYNSDRKDGLADLEKTFEITQLLPGLWDERDCPRAVFFTPVFLESVCFGYAAVDYGETPRSYDDVYRNWMRTVCKGLEALRRELCAESAMEQLSRMRNNKFVAVGALYESLSDEERADYEEVRRILDDDRFEYHFQPIVNTVDGGIYSYEALMRSATEKKIPPLSIIKYAEMQNRLSDVERATFLNVLHIVDTHREELGDAKIFINSIPGIRISGHDFDMVEDYLKKMSDVVVVELTEEAELGDTDLERLKALFRKLDVEIAVDDYGTGYSNVSNLLRYMPHYVKIDRSLLSDIQDKPQKQHFVKEIINFCHDNKIKALAEGVETAAEMRMVIHLGADLIQGFYTGKPSAKFAGSIDEKVRNEIRTYHNERMEGVTDRTYIAGKTNRVALASIMRQNCNEIIIGQGTMVYKDITVIGTPGTKTDIHIKVESGYIGKLTLENVYLSNVRSRPCIEVGENVRMAITVVGDNFLKNSGILVPESSRLAIEGDGNLKIDSNSTEYYGIGNKPDKRHGKIVLEQDGYIEITGSGVSGTCIGSGLGGIIRINRGRCVLESNGQSGVCVGALTGDTDIKIKNCNLTAEFVEMQGVGVGSASGSVKIAVWTSSLRIIGDGTAVAGIGTLEGAVSEMTIENSVVTIGTSAAKATGIGALEGSTRLKAMSAGIKIDSSGEKALSAGGYSEDTQVDIHNCDVRVTVKSKLNTDCFAKPENIRIYNSRARFLINDVETERTVLYEEE